MPFEFGALQYIKWKKMLLKKLNILGLFINICIYLSSNCMQEGDFDEPIVNSEYETSFIEQLPDELLLLVFNQRTNNIINTNYPDKAEKEFKEFFYANCLVNKRFYMFRSDLKKHFDKNKKYQIAEIRNMVFGKLNYNWKLNDILKLK